MIYKNTESSILTVERGMQVLRAFRSDRAPLSNAQLVRITGLPKATVSRLTSTMLQTGYLSRVPGAREFEYSVQSYSVGHSFLANSELLKLAHPLMQDMADKLNASVALGIRDGTEILYIGYRVSAKVKTLRLGVGSVLPMGITAIGRAYMYSLEISEQQLIMDKLADIAGDQSTWLRRKIYESFEEIKNTGTCAVLGGYQRGSYAVAIPISVGRKRTVMGLSCGHVALNPSIDEEKKRISPALISLASELEEVLENFDEIH